MLRRCVSLSVLLGCLLSASPVGFGRSAQDGANDSTFNVLDDGVFGDGAAAYGALDGPVLATARQPDERIWVVGSFTRYHGAPAPGIVRVDAEGGLDPSFQPNGGIPADSTIRVIALQPDGRALIAGDFASYDGVARIGMARVDANGRLDTSFDPGLGSGGIRAIALQPDGKILVGGGFTYFNGFYRPHIARLHPNGAVDLSFDPGSGPYGGLFPTIAAIAVQANGEILVGGKFNFFDGILRHRLARLLPDGSVDLSYNNFDGPDFPVLAIALQADGKAIIGGRFGSYDGAPRHGVARLELDSSLDTTFDPGGGVDGEIGTIQILPNGQVLVGGAFNFFANFWRRGVARLNANGSLDAAFDPGAGPDGAVDSLHVTATGQVVIGGSFQTCAGFPRSGLARLTATGAHDAGFNPGRGASSTVEAVVSLPDGRALIAGTFKTFNNVPRARLARLDASGALDLTFDPGVGPNAGVSTLAVQPDGRVILGGYFVSYAGAARRYVARIQPDGALDPSFDVGAGPSGGGVEATVLQRDGKVIVAGTFPSFAGVPCNNIVRLSVDGSLDSGFDVGAGADNTIRAVALQPDGKILVAGAFSTFDGVARNRIARLAPDGGLDPTFGGALGPDQDVFALALERDGALLVGGKFATFALANVGCLARLQADGSLDANFTPFAGSSARVDALALQFDGKTIAAGYWPNSTSVPLAGVARFEPDGSTDLGFNPGLGPSNTIRSIALAPAGDAILVGDFTRFDGVARNRVARIRATWPAAAPYCTAGVSANGCTPTMGFVGSPSLSAASGFTIHVAGLDGQRQGLVFYGVDGRKSDPWSPASTSFLCVKSPVQRMNVATSGGTLGQCNGSLRYDWLEFVAAHPASLGAPFQAGDVVDAQAWFRDPAAPTGTNLSNALEFLAAP